MTGSHADHTALSGRRTLRSLIVAYFATLAALCLTIWFELPNEPAYALLAAALAIALLAALCTGRTVSRSQQAMKFRERPSISGRGAGVLVFVGLALLALACTLLLPPRSWPTTVNGALARLDQQLSAESKKQLAYTGYDELFEAHEGLSTAIRHRYGMLGGGMWGRNFRLLHDCDAEYIHASTCSSLIVSRYWKRVRAQLPPEERVPLEALEAKMERVRLEARTEFKSVPFETVVAAFEEAIRAQLPESEQFAIRYDPAHAGEQVSVSWHAREPISLREAIGYLAEDTGMQLRKAPPDLLLERK